MASLADIMRQRYGAGQVWDTSGDISHEGEPMPGVSKAPDVSGLQWWPSTNGNQWAGLFQQPQAMTFQPQGLLDMITGRPDAPLGSMPQGLLSMMAGRPDAPLATGPDRFAGVAPMPHARPIKPGTYVIRKGDTLERIARRFGTTVKALAAKNGIKNVNRIKAGATLTL